ncbi:MAG: DNA/RNA non-specific endonuclease [Acidobacteriota bacterium]
MHLICPNKNCGRLYFSSSTSRQRCRRCNTFLVRNTSRWSQKPSIGEIDLDLNTANRPKRHSTRIDFSGMDGSIDNLKKDSSFEPPARHHSPIARCTGASANSALWKMTTTNGFTGINHNETKQQREPVKGKAGRKNTNSVMGVAIYKKGTVSANQWAKNGSWNRSQPWKNYEWCHLIGDCLGGPTSAANLVAARYCANTYMAALEVILAGKTKYKVDVKALCSRQHLGVVIDYRVVASKTWTNFVIPAGLMAFSRSDFQAVQKRLKSWLNKNR